MDTSKNISLQRVIVLPKPACTYADHSYPAYTEKEVRDILLSLGYLVRSHNGGWEE